MIRYNILSVLLLMLLLTPSCNPTYNPAITEEDLHEDLQFLATDSLKGRYPGTPEDSVLLGFIAGKFESFGLKPLDDQYVQYFDVISAISPSPGNELSVRGKSFVQDTDFLPMEYSSNDSLSCLVEFCGYGFEIQNDTFNWDDYSGKDLNGKWALILRGEPANKDIFMDHSRDRDKILLAKDKGAAGVIFAAGEDYDPSDNFPEQRGKEPAVGLPVIQVKRKVANVIMEGSGFTVEQAEKEILAGKNPGIFLSLSPLKGRINMVRTYARTGNVAAVLEGSDPLLKDQWVVIGAHEDHLGMGGPGSSSRRPDTIAIHYGADDNASGTASILELAGYFSGMKERPRRSILFITFGAEEMGILGSRYFVEHPGIDLKKISVMLNIDMIGRMTPDSMVQIGGVGTSVETREIVTALNKDYHLRLELSDAGYGPSDHASFYAKDVPVMFFSTGPHKDYHTPFDRVDSLNITGMVLADRYIADIARNVANRDSVLHFREAGPKESTSRSYRNRITLGIMPDVSGEGKDGMEVLAVTKGKPADQGGMLRGDIIVAIEGKPVGNVYDYMYRLNTMKYGQRIVVTVKRNGSLVDLLIQL